MYAVIETGGKQYRVSVGDTIDVERLDASIDDVIALDRVLMVGDGEDVQVGRPTVQDAEVKATVVAQDRAKKVIVFKYRPKQRFRRKVGHRQHYTRLRIDEINA